MPAMHVFYILNDHYIATVHFLSLHDYHLKALIELSDVRVPDFSLLQALQTFGGLKR